MNNTYFSNSQFGTCLFTILMSVVNTKDELGRFSELVEAKVSNNLTIKILHIIFSELQKAPEDNPFQSWVKW
jgi:hypothetical protein